MAITELLNLEVKPRKREEHDEYDDLERDEVHVY